MGMELLNGGYRDGELALDVADAASSANPYFGGQPAQIGANGAKLCKQADEAGCIGVFQNSSFEDLKNGNTTVVTGTSKVRFINGAVGQDNQDEAGNVVEGAPFDTGVTFAVGDDLFIDSNGKWARTGTGGQRKGIVLKAPVATDDTLEAYFFGGQNG